MDANQTCDILLSLVKKSNLNFSLSESPFSVSLTIKKTFIKDKNGAPRVSNIATPGPECSCQSDKLFTKLQLLQDEINDLKTAATACDDENPVDKTSIKLRNTNSPKPRCGTQQTTYSLSSLAPAITPLQTKNSSFQPMLKTLNNDTLNSASNNNNTLSPKTTQNSSLNPSTASFFYQYQTNLTSLAQTITKHNPTLALPSDQGILATGAPIYSPRKPTRSPNPRTPPGYPTPKTPSPRRPPRSPTPQTPPLPPPPGYPTPKTPNQISPPDPLPFAPGPPPSVFGFTAE